MKFVTKGRGRPVVTRRAHIRASRRRLVGQGKSAKMSFIKEIAKKGLKMGAEYAASKDPRAAAILNAVTSVKESFDQKKQEKQEGGALFSSTKSLYEQKHGQKRPIVQKMIKAVKKIQAKKMAKAVKLSGGKIKISKAMGKTIKKGLGMAATYMIPGVGPALATAELAGALMGKKHKGGGRKMKALQTCVEKM